MPELKFGPANPGSPGAARWRCDMASDVRAAAVAIPADALLDHWQGHRRVTRRVIEAFPEDALFNYSIGGMRPFASMAFEMISMASAGVRGIATGKWDTGSDLLHHSGTPAPATREALLAPMGRDDQRDRRALAADSTRSASWRSTPPSAPMRASSSACFSTGSTTRFTTAARDTSTCERSGSSRRRSTTEADEVP